MNFHYITSFKIYTIIPGSISSDTWKYIWSHQHKNRCSPEVLSCSINKINMYFNTYHSYIWTLTEIYPKLLNLCHKLTITDYLMNFQQKDSKVFISIISNMWTNKPSHLSRSTGLTREKAARYLIWHFPHPHPKKSFPIQIRVKKYFIFAISLLSYFPFSPEPKLIVSTFNIPQILPWLWLIPSVLPNPVNIFPSLFVTICLPSYDWFP